MKGFLGYQPLFMLDFVLVSQMGIIPMLGLAIFWAKRRKYKLHSRLMMALTAVLLVAVVLFELEVRLHGGMGHIAGMVGKGANVETSFFKVLFFVHLLFCGLVAPLWMFLIYKALRNFGFRDPHPTAHGPRHRRMARVALVGALLIAVTGIMSYVFAFVV